MTFSMIPAVRGTLPLRLLSYSDYPVGRNDKLKILPFPLPAGKAIEIVAESGSDTSSIVRMMVRLLAAQSSSANNQALAGLHVETAGAEVTGMDAEPGPPYIGRY